MLKGAAAEEFVWGRGLLRALGSSRLGLGLLGTVLVLAGCSEMESGSAVTDGETSTSASPIGESSTVGPSSSSAENDPGGDGVAASVDPCDLLTEEELSEYGEFEEPAPNEIRGTPVCEFKRVPSVDNQGASFLTAVFSDQGVDELRDQGLGVDEGEMDSGREFAQAQQDDQGMNCSQALALTEHERVDVQAAGAEAGAGCAVAAELAELVEPKLP